MESRLPPAAEPPLRAVQRPPSQPVPQAVPGLPSARPIAQAASRSAFVPLLLLSLAMLLWLAFQSTQLWSERQQIARAHSALDGPTQSATKLRASLDAVATSTAKLAADGNANARTIVDELRKRGVTIHPTGAAKTP